MSACFGTLYSCLHLLADLKTEASQLRMIRFDGTACRALSEMFAGFQNMNLTTRRPVPGCLDPLTESPVSSKGKQHSLSSVHRRSSSGTIDGSVLPTTKPSPLGRKVVTALEAELDQVCATAFLAPPPGRGHRFYQNHAKSCV